MVVVAVQVGAFFVDVHAFTNIGISDLTSWAGLEGALSSSNALTVFFVEFESEERWALEIALMLTVRFTRASSAIPCGAWCTHNFFAVGLEWHTGAGLEVWALVLVASYITLAKWNAMCLIIVEVGILWAVNVISFHVDWNALAIVFIQFQSKEFWAVKITISVHWLIVIVVITWWHIIIIIIIVFTIVIVVILGATSLTVHIHTLTLLDIKVEAKELRALLMAIVVTAPFMVLLN